MIVLGALLVAAAATVAAPAADRPLAAMAMMPTPRAIVPVPGNAKPTREQVLAAVKAEWPKYDTRATGRLAPLEFATWVMRANNVAVAPAGAKKAAGVTPVAAMNATARAFAMADADHDGGVTPEEMAAFLLR